MYFIKQMELLSVTKITRFDKKFNLLKIKGSLGYQYFILPKTIKMGKLNGSSYKTILEFFFFYKKNSYEFTKNYINTFLNLIKNYLKTLNKNLNIGLFQELSLVGVGFRSYLSSNKKKLGFKLGYSHKVYYELPKGIWATNPTRYKVRLYSPSKFLLNQVSLDLKNLRYPDIYKGKGIRFLGENLKFKEGKKEN